MGVKFVGLEPSTGFENQIPACPHGPMLLFERTGDNAKTGRQFYACSAYRDRKHCAFFLWRDEALSAAKLLQWRLRAESSVPEPTPDHAIRYARAQALLLESNTRYCLTCSCVVNARGTEPHRAHEMRPIAALAASPSQLLRPLSANKGAAQYLFSCGTVTALLAVLQHQCVTRVLCCGAPRIHEELRRRGVDSLMLDMDRRYEEFWCSERLVIFNMFNNYAFTEHGRSVLREFIDRNHGQGLGIVVDPPFGGRLEALALTLDSLLAGATSCSDGRLGAELSIGGASTGAGERVTTTTSRLPAPAASSVDGGTELQLMPQPPTLQSSTQESGSTMKRVSLLLILPYFNEPDVLRCMPELHMTDLRIEYDNHASFNSGAGGRKYGSPVRLFTNIPPGEVLLPESQYRLCTPCQRWVHKDNVHCIRCNACTSKDGRPYWHCKACARCVKKTWSHCNVCGRCALPDHPCTRTAAPAAGSRCGQAPPRRPSHGGRRKRRKFI